MTDFDPVWYRTVMDVSTLQKDVDDLPDGDQTLIGSRGLALSAGQSNESHAHPLHCLLLLCYISLVNCKSNICQERAGTFR